MKNLLIIMLFISACNNPIKQRDTTINKAIVNYFDSNINANKSGAINKVKLDSIRIYYTDSLTKIELANFQVGQITKAFNKVEKYFQALNAETKLKLSLWGLSSGIERQKYRSETYDLIRQDSLVTIKMESLRNMSDSILKSAKNPDSNNFCGYLVRAKYYLDISGEHKTDSGIFFVNNQFKASVL